MALRQWILGVSAGLLASAVIAAPMKSDHVAIEKLVATVAKGQLVIQHYIPAPDNLQGVIVAPKAGGRAIVLYADKQGRYLVAGNVIDAKGKNLTQADTAKYITAQAAKKAYLAAAKTHWFAQGSDKAPHKLYVAIDPNCSFCHLMYKELYPLIQAGKLQVRWIPVAILKPTSKGKSAALLAAGSDKASVALLHKDEMQFDLRHEEGGIQPLKPDANNVAVSTAFSRVDANTAFFTGNGFNGTPTLVYKSDQGHYGFYPGYIRGAALQKLMNKMGSQW